MSKMLAYTRVKLRKCRGQRVTKRKPSKILKVLYYILGTFIISYWFVFILISPWFR